MSGAEVHASPSKEALRCEGQARDAQLARDKHAYTSARPLLLACARAECPALIQKDCSRWLDEVDAATPTLVIEVRGSAGGDARIVMDGRPLSGAFEGASVAVDPGPHHFVVQVMGRANLERDIVVFEGEKLRKLTFELPATVPPPTGPVRNEPQKPPPEAEHIGPPVPAARARPALPVAFWIATSTAIAGLAAGGILTYVSAVQRGFLADQCDSLAGCSDGEKSALRTRLLVGEVTLGVGIVAGVVATIIYLVDHRAAPAR